MIKELVQMNVSVAVVSNCTETYKHTKHTEIYKHTKSGVPKHQRPLNAF